MGTEFDKIYEKDFGIWENLENRLSKNILKRIGDSGNVSKPQNILGISQSLELTIKNRIELMQKAKNPEAKKEELLRNFQELEKIQNRIHSALTKSIGEDGNCSDDKETYSLAKSLDIMQKSKFDIIKEIKETESKQEKEQQTKPLKAQ